MASKELFSCNSPLYSVHCLGKGEFYVAGGGGQARTGVPNVLVRLGVLQSEWTMVIGGGEPGICKMVQFSCAHGSAKSVIFDSNRYHLSSVLCGSIHSIDY